MADANTVSAALATLGGSGWTINPGWTPASPALVFAKSAVAAVCPADTSEDILATITIPAGAMGPNGMVRVRTRWTYTNGANNKTLRVRFGGVGGTVYTSGTVTANNGGSLETLVANRGATNSQVGLSSLDGSQGYTAQTLITSAVDTTAAVTIVITGQKASAGDTLTLEGYVAEIL